MFDFFYQLTVCMVLGMVVSANIQSQPLGKLRQEDQKFEASLGNLLRPYLKIK